MPAGITGVVALIRWAYYTAAAVNGYTVTRDPVTRAWSVTGTIVMADAFKLTQRPLKFVAPHATGEWVWPIESPMPRVAGPFMAKLGAPIEDGTPYVQ
jgi:hypothetical protein